MTTTATKSATPTKLRNGDWGARVKGKASEGDRITITTKASKSWEAIVGCENVDIIDTSGHATSWQATYDPTTGELPGGVTWVEEGEEMELPFHGFARSAETTGSAD